MSDCTPCTVKKIGEQVGMTPIDWAEFNDPYRLVIVFEQGPKLTFYKDAIPETMQAEEPKPAKAQKPRRKKK